MKVTRVGSCVHAKQQLEALQMVKNCSCPSRAYLAVSVWFKTRDINYYGPLCMITSFVYTALIATWYVLLVTAFSFSRKFLEESPSSICNQWFTINTSYQDYCHLLHRTPMSASPMSASPMLLDFLLVESLSLLQYHHHILMLTGNKTWQLQAQDIVAH